MCTYSSTSYYVRLDERKKYTPVIPVIKNRGIFTTFKNPCIDKSSSVDLEKKFRKKVILKLHNEGCETGKIQQHGLFAYQTAKYPKSSSPNLNNYKYTIIIQTDVSGRKG
jgi:hypothetical protein